VRFPGSGGVTPPFLIFSQSESYKNEKMKVERVKYLIWAVDMKRALRFYRDVLGGKIMKDSEVISEVVVNGATIGIHSGGEGKRTWTGLSFQVLDVIEGRRK
jgi:lactoylglutathione lyase